MNERLQATRAFPQAAVQPAANGRRRGGSETAPGPVNTVAPVVEVTPPGDLGDLAAVTNGTWTTLGTISGYTYQWLRAGNVIAGAELNYYNLFFEDDSQSISCRVTATDEFGSRAVTSNAVPIELAPVWTDDPAIDFNVSDPLLLQLVYAGGADFATDLTYALQWYVAGVSAPGETGADFTGALEDGVYYQLEVTAINQAKTSNRISNTAYFYA